jgi:hypothetical protein
LAIDLQSGLNHLGIAQSVFASGYAGVPATRLSQCLNGVRPWDMKDLAACERALTEMLDLAASVSPLPIDWSQAGKVRTVLESRRMQKTWVVTTSSGIFISLNAAYRPVFDQTGVALTGAGAHRICEELRKLNYQNVKAVERQLLAGETSLDFFSAWKPR